MPALVPAAPLSSQLSANAPEETAKDGPGPWDPNGAPAS